MLRISSHVIQQLYFNKYLANASQYNISANQFYILKLLTITGSYNLSAVARTLEISNAAAGKNIDKLVQLKLVHRRFRKADRRVTNLTITDAGRQIVADYDAVRDVNQANVLRQYTSDEKELFIDYIRRFLNSTLKDITNTELICLQCNESCGDDCIVRECQGQCSFHLLSNSEE